MDLKLTNMRAGMRFVVASVTVVLATPAAFALTPGSGTWIAETATYGTPNLKNAYVYVPSNPAPAVKRGKRALMLTLHGCGGNANGTVINNAYNWEKIAEEKGMVVVAPTVPDGINLTRLLPGCWDWNGANHNRISRDTLPLKNLLDAIKARPNLDIDPDQIYVTGFSAGAGETIVLGCSLPDYFAGVGQSAGPTLGSGPFDIFFDPIPTAQQVRDTCKAINGDHPTYNAMYESQIYNTMYGVADGLVKPTHNIRNAEGMRLLYGTTPNATSFTVDGGGSGTLWVDEKGRQRVSVIAVSGMGHSWSAGPGGYGSDQADYTHINYPTWVTNWFFENNLRIRDKTTVDPSVTCFNSTNAAHISAGRAFEFLFQAFAKGSNQPLGAPNSATSTKLRYVQPDYYVTDASCP